VTGRKLTILGDARKINELHSTPTNIAWVSTKFVQNALTKAGNLDPEGDVLRRSSGGRFASAPFPALRLGDSKTVLMDYIYSESDRRPTAPLPRRRG
jgi:hypothetical protein